MCMLVHDDTCAIFMAMVWYCMVCGVLYVTTASIKDQTNRVSAVFQARRVKGDISVTGTIRDSYFSRLWSKRLTEH